VNASATQMKKRYVFDFTSKADVDYFVFRSNSLDKKEEVITISGNILHTTVNTDITILRCSTFNDPISVLSQFKPNFYDLLLIDINMPDMNGFELCTEILKVDVNVKICFMSAGEVNHEAVRELYPTISIGCFIKEPIAIDYLVKRIKAELE